MDFNKVLKDLLERTGLTKDKLLRMTYSEIKNIKELCMWEKLFLVFYWKECRRDAGMKFAYCKGIVNPCRCNNKYFHPLLLMPLDDLMDFMAQ